ncbi:MAG: hypothetical protein KAS32_28695, partial [Candidatus Peribacteraceae bacterium]|nr:hypothetical protein [Candidatus Peribacteraceae bacterium]
QYQDKAHEIYKELDGYEEGNLEDAIESENEIMLTGDSYTMIRSDYLPYVLHYIGKMGSKQPNPIRWRKAMSDFDIKKQKTIDTRHTIGKHINKDILSILDN